MNPLHYPSPELCEKLTNIDFPETEIMLDSINPYRIGGMDVFPSVMEMLDVMPADIHVGHHQYTWSITPYGFTYAPNQSHGTDKIPFFATDDMESISIDPNAAAEMILWLHENKYITFNNDK